MRWSIVRLIWLRELRDQLRDRRTVFMIAVLPVLLYPLAGFGVLQLAAGFLDQTNVVGVAGAENLLPWHPAPADAAGPAATAASWLACTPPASGAPLAGAAHAAGALALALAQPPRDYPPLLEEQGSRLSFRTEYTGEGTAHL